MSGINREDEALSLLAVVLDEQDGKEEAEEGERGGKDGNVATNSRLSVCGKTE